VFPSVPEYWIFILLSFDKVCQPVTNWSPVHLVLMYYNRIKRIEMQHRLDLKADIVGDCKKKYNGVV
jgi:hypothetical protein